MKGVYVQQNSPYYWIRYYDKYVLNPAQKRKSVNTKIPVTPADKRKIEVSKKTGEKPDLQGTPELRKLVRDFKRGLAERNIMSNSNSILKKDKKLSEGFKEFKEFRSIPGSKKFLKLKTLSNYDIAVDHFLTVAGDKYIYKYSEKDYVNLLYLFEEKGLSINSRSIYTRSLHSLWKYFVEKFYTNHNIIETIPSEEKDPDPILLEDMYSIISYLKQDENYRHHYWITYFMLLTGCRPSSAIVQLKEDIDFKRKRITIKNIKAGVRKGKQFYRFPLYAELEKLIREMGVKEGDSGRLFDMFAVVPANYTWPLSFWDRRIGLLLRAKSISKRYTLKQIRPTLASFLINVLKTDIYTVKKLLDHANIKITDKSYVDFNVNVARKDLDDVTLESFLDEDY